LKILLIGERGQLAWELIRTLMPIGEVISVDFPAFDISNRTQISDTLSTIKPELVINASAYTNVDLAETEKEIAMAVNADGPGWLARECNRRRFLLIHYSTDFVFDGSKRTPYVETDKPNPINVYGLSKLKGEESIQAETDSALIFRLAWLYSARGNNFVTKFLEWAAKYETVRIVDDQIGNPTWARFVAEATASVLAQAMPSGLSLYDWVREKNGVYHLTSAGEASRYDWAQKIWELAPNRDMLKLKEIQRANSADFPTPAERPMYTALDCGKIKQSCRTNVSNWIKQQINNLEV